MALHFKLKLLLWISSFQKQPDIQKSTPEAVRAYNKERVKKLAKLTQYKPEELFLVKDEIVKTEETEVPIRIYQPIEGDNFPITMYFHGGGFVLGDLESHDNLCRRMAKQTNCIVIAVDYRLAPESKYPAAPNDCYQATLWAYENAKSLNADPNRIATAGDSAGANLATVVCLMARDKKAPFKICQQILIYPTVDGLLSSESIDRLAEGYILTKELMQWFLNHYLAEEANLKESYFSPIHTEDLSNLPPALVITAEYDPLIDEGKAYANKLKEVGNEVIYKEFKGMVHVFYQMPKFLKATRQAEKLVAKTLQTAFGTHGIV